MQLEHRWRRQQQQQYQRQQQQQSKISVNKERNREQKWKIMTILKNELFQRKWVSVFSHFSKKNGKQEMAAKKLQQICKKNCGILKNFVQWQKTENNLSLRIWPTFSFALWSNNWILMSHGITEKHSVWNHDSKLKKFQLKTFQDFFYFYEKSSSSSLTWWFTAAEQAVTGLDLGRGRWCETLLTTCWHVL